MAKDSQYAALSESEMYTQVDPLKQGKDMKNLVSSDFEQEYRGMMETRGRRKRGRRVGLVAALVIVFLWLVTLTVLREVQLSQLRREYSQLKDSVIEITNTLNNFNLKYSNNKLFDDTNILGDTIYADEDLPSTEDGDSKKDEDMEKLHGLTVLESEDDEDLYDDDDDVESGDWYPDYDKRREKVGHTNMVKLRPEDYAGSDTITITDKKQLDDIMKRLNENPELTDIGLQGLSPSDDEPTKKQNRSRRHVIDEPQTFTQRENRHKRKKYMPPAAFTASSMDEVTQDTHNSGRIVRDSDVLDATQRSKFIAAHFHGDTSRLSMDRHPHYQGNGKVRVDDRDSPHNVWTASDWSNTIDGPRVMDNGHIVVRHTGLYLVYVQIYFLDTHDIVSWVLDKTSEGSYSRETLLRCALHSHSTSPHVERANSCFSSAALFLQAGDKLAVRNTRSGVHSLMQKDKSFIGLIKLADFMG